MTTTSSTKISVRDRLIGALWGIFVGDAHAVPIHWYYSLDVMRQHVKEFYQDDKKNNRITEIHQVNPNVPHPDSHQYTSKQDPTDYKLKIFHIPNIKQLYHTPGLHYHKTLKKGENTHNVQLSLRLMQTITENKESYNSDEYLKKYLDFFLTPGRNTDTYIEGIHRNFFINYAEGKDINDCGKENETCLSGYALVLPLILRFAALHGNDYLQEKVEAQDLFKATVGKHLSLTHKSAEMRYNCEVLTELLSKIFRGDEIHEALTTAFVQYTQDEDLNLKQLVTEITDNEEVFGRIGCKRFSIS